MKKILTVILLISLAMSGFSQVKDSSAIKARDNYLRKSKNSKTTGLIMLGGGAVLAITGIILFDEGWENSGGDTQAAAGGVMFIVGGLSMLGSVFPLIQSGIYKSKAMEMSAGIKVDKIIPDGLSKTYSTYYPALSVKLNIR